MQLFVGQPVSNPHSDVGYIASIEARTSGATHILGAGGMQRITQRIQVVYPGDKPRLSEDVSEQQAEQWASRAAHCEPIDPAELPALIAAARTYSEQAQQAARQAREDKAAARIAYLAEYGPKIPAWAKGVIIAHRHIDESDSMTDYFGHRVAESIVLGFSKHTRDLFPELRKAAANAPETAHLADKPVCPDNNHPRDEHREKYSMGGGFYLGVYRNSNGWTIRKHTTYGDRGLAEELPTGARWCVDVKPAPVASVAAGVDIQQHVHTKKGFTFYLVVLAARVDAEQFDALRDACKAAGGWYSRQWGKTPGGFAFKERADAVAFAAGVAPAPATPPTPTNHAAKFRALAGTMSTAIEACFADRLENTAKRIGQAASARREGYHLQRTQRALEALADLYDAGTVPEVLQGLRNRAQVHAHMGSKSSVVSTGSDPVTLALWAILDAPSGPRPEDELKAKLNALRRSGIPGYFPTVGDAQQRVIDAAEIEPYHHVLEPSAGSGELALAVQAQLSDEAGGLLAVFEIRPALCEVLQLRGFDARPTDMLELRPGAMRYDRIVMNPPFENLQDVAHVVHAYKFLKPGGRLVAIMSPAAFQRDTAKCEGFRDWLRLVGGTAEDMPEGSFKASGTSVATKLVVIDKAGVPR